MKPPLNVTNPNAALTLKLGREGEGVVMYPLPAKSVAAFISELLYSSEVAAWL